MDVSQSVTEQQSSNNGFGIVDLDSLATDITLTPLLLPICDAIGGINSEFVYCK